jgi:hypothetical protein
VLRLFATQNKENKKITIVIHFGEGKIEFTCQNLIGMIHEYDE